MGERLSTELVEKTPCQAIRHRGPISGLIHHSDRGCQYTSAEFQKLTTENGIILSMSGKGNCYDNTVMESFFHTLKTEHVYQCKFSTRDELAVTHKYQMNILTHLTQCEFHTSSHILQLKPALPDLLPSRVSIRFASKKPH